MEGFFMRIANALPKLKTRIQLTGVIILVGGIIATRAIAPDQTLPTVYVGAIGILFIVFGQVFPYLRTFPEKDRANLLVKLFLIFSLLILGLVALLIFSPSKSEHKDPIVISQAKEIVLMDSFGKVYDTNSKKANRLNANDIDELILSDLRREINFKRNIENVTKTWNNYGEIRKADLIIIHQSCFLPDTVKDVNHHHGAIAELKKFVIRMRDSKAKFLIYSRGDSLEGEMMIADLEGNYPVLKDRMVYFSMIRNEVIKNFSDPDIQADFKVEIRKLLGIKTT